MMKSLIRIAKGGLLCTGLIVTAGYATAQQPAEGRTDVTVAGASTVEAGQELKIEVVDEPAELTLHLADPALLEQRYVATIRLESIRPLTPELRPYFQMLPNELQIMLLRFELPPRSISIATMVDESIELIPVKERPSQKIIDALTVGSRRNVRWQLFRRGVRYEFLAANADRAVELARAFVAIKDRGVFRKLNQVIADRIEVEVKKQREGEIANEQATKRSRQLEAEVGKLPEIDKGSLADLKNHQRFVEVDISGVRARIDACNRLLQKKMREAQIEKLEDIKLTAEVELVGLNARNEALSRIVGMGERYRKSHLELASLNHQSERRSTNIRLGQERMARLKELREHFALSVLDNKIVVQPIAWKAAEESPKK